MNYITRSLPSKQGPKLKYPEKWVRFRSSIHKYENIKSIEPFGLNEVIIALESGKIFFQEFQSEKGKDEFLDKFTDFISNAEKCLHIQ